MRNFAETTLTDLEAKQELERLLADPRLELSARGRASLKYLAEAGFSGESRADVYAMGKTLFGRGDKFNPLHDPIVRIEVGRLRRVLAHYYDVYGAELRARIIISHGNYIPRFVIGSDIEQPPPGQFSDQDDTELEAPELETRSPAGTTAGQFVEQLQSYLAIAGAVFVIIGGFFLGLWILLRS